MRISDWSSDVCSSDLALDASDDVVGGDDLRIHRVLRRERRALEFDRLEVARPRLLLQRLEIEAGTLEQFDREVALDPAFHLRVRAGGILAHHRSEEHTSELQSLMRISYAVFCLQKKKHKPHQNVYNPQVRPRTPL